MSQMHLETTSHGNVPRLHDARASRRAGCCTLALRGKYSVLLYLPAERMKGHRAGHKVVIVSSGAIGVGCLRLGLKERPSAIAQKQALAAVGQVHLMRYYEDFFSAVGLVL